MAKSQIHVNGTVKYSGKVFTACDIMVPDEIDEKTAAHLVRIGAATVSKGKVKVEEEPIEGAEDDNEGATSGNENSDQGSSGDSTSGNSTSGDGNSNEGEVDDLTGINGIGKKTEINLINAGYDTFEKIAEADPKELAKVDGVSKKEAPQFIATAKDIVKEDSKD